MPEIFREKYKDERLVYEKTYKIKFFPISYL